MNVPSVASGRFEAMNGTVLPSLVYFPILGPNISAPAKAAQPPTECTTVDPAKSKKPIASKKPPPHFHDACNG